jgi:NADPH-dependent ferric siderophore reductase
MNSTSSPAPGAPDAPRVRKPRFATTVRRVERLTPHMVRVTFAGEELAGFTWSGPASHVKLIFGSAGAPQSPQSGADTRPTMRTYTPRRFDPASCELEVDFVIHGEGPASAWAAQARAGQALTIAGPGRSYAVAADAPWYLLAGDDTAIPAIETILRELPAASRALVLLEVIDAAEQHSLESGRAQVEIQWLPRGPDPQRAGRELEAAIRRLELPSGAGHIYVACEADAMRRIRRHLLTERQVPRAQLVTRGYWRLGETDHPDRDYGEDVA